MFRSKAMIWPLLAFGNGKVRAKDPPEVHGPCKELIRLSLRHRRLVSG